MLLFGVLAKLVGGALINNVVLVWCFGLVQQLTTLKHQTKTIQTKNTNIN